MITGFNTDVRHDDVVFHVQTEDKGTSNPCIESLVYVGGQILARKRAGYRSLLDGDEATKAVTELMERQHRSMIEEIRSGKMDEKVAAIKGGPPKAAAPAPVAPSEQPTAQPEAATARPPAPPAPAEPPPATVPPFDASTAIPQKMPPIPTKSVPPPKPQSHPIPVPPPNPPPRKPSKPSAEWHEDRTLDQVILDYLEMESGQNRLVFSMERRSGEMAPGKEATLWFRTESSVDSDPIGEALITVRLISTISEPKVLAQGQTDDDGEVELRIAIPDLQAGSGALIISAESSIGDAETRHLI